MQPENTPDAAKPRRQRKRIPRHPSVTAEGIMALVKEDDNLGLCLECGEEAVCVEPDAIRYTCTSCGSHRVFGAEMLLLML